MDVKLVLAAPVGRIDGQADRSARQGMSRRALREAALAPGGGKIIRGARLEQFRAFNATDVGGCYQQILGVADDILENDVTALDAALQVDARARCRIGKLLLVGHALIVDDRPQRVAVKGAREAERAEEHNCGRSRCQQPPIQNSALRDWHRTLAQKAQRCITTPAPTPGAGRSILTRCRGFLVAVGVARLNATG